MIAETYKNMLNGKSVIRQLSEFATKRGEEIGYENVFDYSLGNPSVPVAQEFTDYMIKLLQEENPMALHGYSQSLGIPAVRQKVAASLAKRFDIPYTMDEIFMTSGAAGAIAHAVRCVTVPGDEVLTFAPFFPEYKVFVEAADASDNKYERTNTLCVQAVPDGYMKVFDQEDHPIALKPGEIAFSKLEAEENGLQLGDRVKIKIGEIEQEFTIAAIAKDAVFGSSMMGFKRLIISEEDFERFANQDNLTHTKIYCFNYEDKKEFNADWQKQNFNVISMIDKSLLSMCFIFDMLIAGILIIVSICLILIAFMVLRFTIVFTLQEDFREIGIMKAIGLKDSGIKSVYLIKYFGISILAASVGVILSFPFGKLLLTHSVENLVVSEVAQNIFLHILCAIVVVGVVLWFSNSSANSLKKYSAIDAIRNGSNGERYQAISRIRLWKRGWMKPGFYMALNDILSNSKRFLMLIITFCLGTLLILVPLSAVHTLTGEKIITLFGMASSDVYINNGKKVIIYKR